jgi:hypothetical protein
MLETLPDLFYAYQYRAIIQEVLTDVATAVTDHAALCDATASLRGEVLHLMVRGALPRPPQPDHVVEIITL